MMAAAPTTVAPTALVGMFPANPALATVAREVEASLHAILHEAVR